MKNFIIKFLIFTILFISCSSNKTIKRDISISELNNYAVSGIQEDKLRQANNLFYKGGFSSAIEIYKSILESFMGIDNQEAVINLLLIIADTYMEALNYQKAMETIEVAKNRIETIFTDNSKKTKYLALYTTVLAKLMFGYNDKEFVYIREEILNFSHFMAMKVRDPNILMKSYINLGYFYLSKKETDLALENFEKALYLANYTGKKYSYATLCEIIGRIYTEKEDFKSSRKYFITAYSILADNNYFLPLGRLMIRIGDLLVKENNLNLAVSFYSRAFEIILYNEDIDREIKEYYTKEIENKLSGLKIKIPSIRLK